MSISVAAATAAIDIAKKLTERWFDSKKRNDQDLVSIGLAVGYFYNFLDPLNNVLVVNALDLYTTPELESKEEGVLAPKKTFELEDVHVEIIIPKRLDPEARLACDSVFRQYDKGFFDMKQNKRFYGINYFTSTVGGKEKLTIVDLARPAFAAQRFYEDVLGQRTFKNDEKWYTTQLSELAAFKQTVINLSRLGNGVLVNRLSFKEVG